VGDDLAVGGLRRCLPKPGAKPAQVLLVPYVLERFLSRLSGSGYRDRLVLKREMLLAALGSRRPTADIDLLARSVANDVATVASPLPSGAVRAAPTP
jgi:hypothetical protein